MVLTGGTYRLTIPGASENANATGDLDVTDDLTIRGAGRALTTIDADGPADAAPIDRVLHVISPAGATLKDLGVTGGHARMVSRTAAPARPAAASSTPAA